jgi:hypothetical protein
MKKRISGVVMDGTTGTAVRGTTTISIPEGEHATIEVEVTGQDGVAIDYADYSGCVLTIRAALGDDAPIVARTGSGVGSVLTFEVYGGEVTAGDRYFDVYLLDGDRAAFVTDPVGWEVTRASGDPADEGIGPGYQSIWESVTVTASDTIAVTYPDPFVDASHLLLVSAPYASNGATVALTVTARSASGFTVEASAAFTGSFSYQAKGVRA